MAKDEKKHTAVAQPSAGLVPAPQGEQKLAHPMSQLPAHLRTEVGNKSGFENTEKEDFILPRLSICQSLTPQRKKSNPNFIDGLEEGDFFNTITGRIYGKKITAIPLFFTRNRIKFLEPIGSGIDCQSMNGRDGGRLNPSGCRTCTHAQWGEDGPACTEFKNIVLLVQDDQEPGGISTPIMFSNKSTMISVLKQWNSMMNMTNLPMYAGIYSLSTLPTVKNNNEFYTWNFARVGWVPEAMYLAAKNFFEGLHDKDISFNVDDMAAEQTETHSEM